MKFERILIPTLGVVKCRMGQIGRVEEREGLSNDKVCEILSGARLDNLRNG